MVLESALEGEITAHLGYERHERADDEGVENSRNGTRSTTVLTKAGPVEIDVPRDRAGTFEPVVVRKRQRRLGSIEDVVLSLSARGMTHGDICAHLVDVYGSEVSKTTITDKVLDGMAEWQGRPLDPVYPVVSIDLIHVKVALVPPTPERVEAFFDFLKERIATVRKYSTRRQGLRAVSDLVSRGLRSEEVVMLDYV